ncbi:hypothetical protein CBM2634_A190003 [Cupriavidus taiwanensis]|uniref:Uncharacterized protein n=1 Tax=Cupriavidus taiwanensis TaxID=164546 RepID=A0A375IXG6_9BURK|nr:hypothetical protein CBM2634_A190003 [Cupriavidus taiwanensis]
MGLAGGDGEMNDQARAAGVRRAGLAPNRSLSV